MQTVNTLAERLDTIYHHMPQLEGERGQTGLVKASGASKSVVNQWVTGKIKSMDIRYALNIERELGFSHIWLMTGEGDPRQAPLHGVRNALPVRAAANDDADFVQIQMVEPSLYEDDIVIVNTLDTKPVDGAVYAFNYEGEAVVKRLARDAGQWWLTSDNPDQRRYHRKLCKGAECLVIGRVVRKESDRI
jgi:hypothetical protein